MRALRSNNMRVIYDIIRDQDPAMASAVADAAPDPLEGPIELVAAFRRLEERSIVPAEREAFVVFVLDVRNRLLAAQVVSIGSVSNTIAWPREVFRPAIALAGSAVVLAHNHPSGDSSPSTDDSRLTTRLTAAGDLLGIQVRDHLVVTRDRFYSFSMERTFP